MNQSKNLTIKLLEQQPPTIITLN